MTTFAEARQLHPARAADGAATARHDHNHPGGSMAPADAAARATLALAAGDMPTAAYWSGYARSVGALVG